MSKSRPICFFHKNCLDGRASAAVVKKFEGGRCQTVPLQYGLKRRIPVFGKRAWVVDFALDIDEMRRLRKEASECIWLDHHASNRAMHQELGWGTLDEDECGATVTWKHCFPNEPVPEVLRYVRDKDLWLWELPNSRAIAAGLADTFSDRDFDGILEADLDLMRERGEPLVAAQDARVERACKHGVRIDQPYGLKNVESLVINAQSDHSEIGAKVYNSSADNGLGLDLAIMFFLRSDGRWVHTLRSPTVNVAEIASARGGGGHPAAASYVADVPFPLSDDCYNWPV